MTVLYLTEQGSELGRHSQRFELRKDDKTLLEIPECELTRVVVFGAVQLTTQAMRFLLEQSIDTSFFTLSGKYIGRLCGPTDTDVISRLSQARYYQDPQFEIPYARVLVAAKIGNCAAVVLRHIQNHPELAHLTAGLEELTASSDKVSSATDIAELMGIEGDAAKRYFKLFGACFRGSLAFEKRSKHPAEDPVNSCLNFGYALLAGEIQGQLESTGLDPYIGIFHEVGRGRPSLVFDICEEFRHAIDRMSLNLFNLGKLDATSFVSDPDWGFRLQPDALKLFIKNYEALVSDPVKEKSGDQLTYREAFGRQCDRLEKALESGGGYEPFRVER